MKKIVLGLTMILSLNAFACDLSKFHEEDKALTKQIEKDDMKSASKTSDKVLATLKKLVSTCPGDNEVLKLQKTAIANDKMIKEYASH